MSKRSLAYGEALALIEAKINHNIDFNAFTEDLTDVAAIENIFELVKQFKMNGRYQKIPNGTCSSENPFLKEDKACLVIHVLLYESLPDQYKVDRLFIKHLNSCFWCFQFFSQVVRDYYWARKKIESKLGETK